MSHQKTRDALDTLGTILEKDEGRDAVHVAVVCCRAWGKLLPGERVSLVYPLPGDQPEPFPPLVRSVQAIGGPVLGIVDPFLGRAVGGDELFWVFLLPRTITSLTHVWTHPAFPEEPK